MTHKVANQRVLRRRLIEVGRWMWDRDLIAGTEGNLSARLDDGRFLVTPAGRAKGRLDEGDLVVVDPAGRVVEGDLEPSSEIRIHLAAYRLRPDVGGVIHAHPCAVVAHSLAGVAPAPSFNPEVLRAIGPIAEIGHEAPGSEALTARFERVLADHNAFVMVRHGAVTLGDTIEHAYDRLEMFEQLARMQVVAQAIGRRADL